MVAGRRVSEKGNGRADDMGMPALVGAIAKRPRGCVISAEHRYDSEGVSPANFSCLSPWIVVYMEV